MDQKHDHHHGSGNGFLLGFLLGVLVTLLFTTKKGREVLRLLTEKGLEKFSDLEDVLEESGDIDDESEYVNDSMTEPREEKHVNGNSHTNGVKSTRTRQSLRRFFRKK